MRSNPYRNVLKRGVDFQPGFSKLPGQSGQFTDASGTINASSMQDLLGQIGKAMDAQKITQMSASAAETRAQMAADRRSVIMEANSDTTGQQWQMLGEALATEIYETTNREGFARRIMQYKEIGQGEVNQVTIKEKQVVGFIATSASQVMATEIRQRHVIPPDFHANGFVLIDTRELATATSDILEEKYEEGLEAIMVQEDRLWRTMALQASTVRNTKQYFSTFSPAVFARMIDQVAQWGIPVTSCLFSSSLWQDIISNTDFAGVFDPVTKWELLQEGLLGQMYGVSIMTDNFRQPSLKVLNTGEIFIVGAPVHHGVLTQRGSLVAEPINKFADGEAKKGWFMDELISMIVGNALSVCSGQKV